MFNGQKRPVDKVNMSLDDIIKMNKKQGQKAKSPNNANKGGRGLNQKKNFQKPNDQIQKNNNLRQNQQRRQRSNIRFQNQTVAKKPFGILNRSKSIQKKGIQNKRPMKNKPAQLPKRRPVQAQFIANRRRTQNNNRKNTNRNFNGHFQNKVGNSRVTTSQITIIKPSNTSNQQKTSPRKPNVRRTPQKKTPAPIKRVAMQSARKNVQKAKRLLIAKKKPVKQIMTQRYASKLGLAVKSGLVKQRKPASKPTQQKVLQQPRKALAAKQAKPKMMTISIANKINKIKAQKAKAKVKKITALQPTKKPILNRARPQGLSGTTSSRMVFF